MFEANEVYKGLLDLLECGDTVKRGSEGEKP